MEAHAPYWISCCFSLGLYRFLEPSVVTVLVPFQSGRGNRSAHSSPSETGVEVALRFSCTVSVGILSDTGGSLGASIFGYPVHAPRFTSQEHEESSVLN